MEQPAQRNNGPVALVCACCGGENLALPHAINGAHYCEQCGHTLRRLIAQQPTEARRTQG